MEKEELFIPKTKHKGLKIILAILLIAGLIAGGYYLYQQKFNSPKAIISNALVEAKGELAKAVKESNSEEKYKIDGHIKIDSNIKDEAFDTLKNVEFQFNSEVDLKGKIANFILNTKYQNDKLVDIKGYYENELIYFLLDGLHDKYLKINLKELEQNEGAPIEIPEIKISQQDIQVIFDSMITALDKAINNLEIKKSDEKITIDGKEINAINNYIELKGKELNTFIKNVINNLKEDKSFIKVLCKLTDIDENTMTNNITLNLINGIDEDVFQGTYKINFYTDKGLFKKKLISIRQSITQNNITTSINVDKISDDEVLLSISTMGMGYSVKVKKNNSAINILANVNIMGQYINLELNMNYEKIKEVTKFDVTNNQDINTLTEQDMQKIENKLMNNKAILKLKEKLEKN